MPWSRGFVLGLTSRDVFSKTIQQPWNMIYLVQRRNPCRLYIHLAFTCSVGPSSVVWSKLGRAPLFPPMRVLQVQWSWALSLMCEVPWGGILWGPRWKGLTQQLQVSMWDYAFLFIRSTSGMFNLMQGLELEGKGNQRLWPLHLRHWRPMAIAFEDLSLVKKAEIIQD